MKNPIDNNPYRILDLSIYSNSKNVLDKEKYMLKRIKINGELENNDLFSWISKPKISENSINESVSELDNFRERLIYRLFWFDYNGKLFNNYTKYTKEKTVSGISDIRDRHFLAVFSYEFIIGYIEKALNKDIDIDTIIKEVNKFRQKYGIENFLDYWDILDDFDFEVYFKKIEKDNFSIYDISDEDYNDIFLKTASLILNSIREVICGLINLFDMNLSIYLYKCTNNAAFFDEIELDKFNNHIKQDLGGVIIRNCESINNDINNLSDDTNKIRGICIHSYNFVKSKIIPVINAYENFGLDRYAYLQYNNYITETLNIIAIKLYNEFNDFETSLIILWDAANISIEDAELSNTIKNNISAIENNMILDLESLSISFFQKIDALYEESVNLRNSVNELGEYYFNTIKEKLSNLNIIRINMKNCKNLNNSMAIQLYKLSVDIYGNKLDDYENAIKFLKEANLYANEDSEIRTKIISNINILNSILEKEKGYLNIGEEKSLVNNNTFKASKKHFSIKQIANKYSILLLIILIAGSVLSDNKTNSSNTQNTSNITQSTTQNATETNINNNSTTKGELESKINTNKDKLKSMEAELESIKNTIEDYKNQADLLNSEIDQSSDFDPKIYEYNDIVDKYNSDLNQYNNKYSEYESLLKETNDMISKYNSMK